MHLNDARAMDLYTVSAAVSRREKQLRAAGLPLHAHALSYMLSSLSARDALGDWRVLESLAHECQRAAEREATLAWRVGLTVDPQTGQPSRLAAFATHDEAAAYIGTLPDHEAGIYYLDGPCED